jgi:hypothetical protein
MTTGFVAKLHDGEQTFGDFALGCARAFGYLADMRESANDAVIVPVKVIAPHYAASLENVREILEEVTLQPMFTWERKARLFAADAAARNADERAKREASHAKDLAVIARYEQMLEQVKAWTLPSPDHGDLKAFMIEQLNSSMEWDAPSPLSPVAVPPAVIRDKTATEIRDEEIRHAQRAVDDCAKRLAKETQAIAERNLWVAQLCASIG